MVTFIVNLLLLDVPYFIMQAIYDSDSRETKKQWDSAAELVTVASFVDLITLVLFFILMLKDPGNLKRKDEFEFPTWNELMENVNFKMLCPEC